MEEDNTIVITKKNRRLLGFLGVEHEYLVIPPEVLSRGRVPGPARTSRSFWWPSSSGRLST